MIAKMTSKGKLILPLAARKALGGSIVSIDIVGEAVVLKAIKSNSLSAKKQLQELRYISHICDIITPVDTIWNAEIDNIRNVLNMHDAKTQTMTATEAFGDLSQTLSQEAGKDWLDDSRIKDIAGDGRDPWKRSSQL